MHCGTLPAFSLTVLISSFLVMSSMMMVWNRRKCQCMQWMVWASAYLSRLENSVAQWQEVFIQVLQLHNALRSMNTVLEPASQSPESPVVPAFNNKHWSAADIEESWTGIEERVAKKKIERFHRDFKQKRSNCIYQRARRRAQSIPGITPKLKLMTMSSTQTCQKNLSETQRIQLYH